ncbi:MAG: acyltransferase family protein [Eudoraea sp.]|nr:acyltransferase family protein [Eudoraea sp.]
MTGKKIRRYDLDWARVMVFGLLILYHVGMFFVEWGWHVKNNELYPWLQWPMAFVNRWRLPILFVISGMGTFYALSFRSWGQFVWERNKRLGIPLIFGMLLIVPPQVYYERLANAQFTGSLIEFFRTVAYSGIYPEGNFSWHHLWFLPYLLVYSVLLAPLFIYLRRNPDNAFLMWMRKKLNNPYSLFLFIIPLYLFEALLEPFFPVTHALVDDWFALTNFFFLFFYGFLLLCCGDVFWTALDKIKKKALGIGILSFAILIFIWQFEDGIIRHFVEAGIAVLNMWMWILVILGYAAKYRNKPSKWLAYANRAVYPFYILHQTITVAIGYYIKDMEWGFLPKFLILTLGTFGACWVLYDLIILRIPLLHPFFGLKKNSYQIKKTQ